MQITKYNQSCLLVETNDKRILNVLNYFKSVSRTS